MLCKVKKTVLEFGKIKWNQIQQTKIFFEIIQSTKYFTQATNIFFTVYF